VGQLVPFERPWLPWLDRPIQSRQLGLFCDLSDEPPGLIAWLTVRNHRFATGHNWRRGLFLELGWHQALIEVSSPKQLYLKVRGTSPDHFFSL
jgi:internalin A